MNKQSTPIGRQVVYLSDFNEEADKLLENDGKTNLYSFGEAGLDAYFGGGYGKKDDYEIVLLFGDTGIGKSTFALNMVADPIRRGQKVGLLMLEDRGAAANLKLRKMLGQKIIDGNRTNIHFTPDDVVSGEKLWGLEDFIELIDEWFSVRKMDLILLDHIQYTFESAVGLKNENEYIAQRVFVRKLNYLIRKHNKTIILVSHINKSGQAKGMGKIIGSGGIAGSATKVIEILRDKDSEGMMRTMMWKTRHTASRFHDRVFAFDQNQRIVAWDNRKGSGSEIKPLEIPF